VTSQVSPPTLSGPVPRREGSSPDRAQQSARRRAKRSRALKPWLLLSPALLVLGALLIYPLVRVTLISFQDYGLRQIVSGERNFTGFANYVELFTDPLLWQVALPNTAVFAVVNVALTVTLGTLIALLLQALGTRWRAVVTTAIMAAWAVPAVTGTYVWIWMFDPLDGILTQAAGALGFIELGAENWFTERVPFYAIVTLNVVHHGFPFVAVTVLAGLLTIPRELTEAAIMDGANAWRRFWSVTFPTIRPIFAVVTILSTIWDFKVFTQIYLMPGGSGANRDVLNLGVWSYTQSFAQGRYGFGAAIAVVLTLMLMVITVFYIRTLFKDEEL
jgi:N,N'-diacetylchitobiose transport system permease protein